MLPTDGGSVIQVLSPRPAGNTLHQTYSVS
jgi:hypothetical protein